MNIKQNLKCGFSAALCMAAGILMRLLGLVLTPFVALVMLVIYILAGERGADAFADSFDRTFFE